MAYTYMYPRMLVTVDTVVFLRIPDSNIHILLIKRGNEPFKGSYALPGGFPEMGELLVNAAKRELLEETGIELDGLMQLATFDSIERDPRGRNIAIVYYGFASLENLRPKAGDDAIEAKWFPVNALPPLAFDHKEIIEVAMNRIGICNP